MKYTIRYHENCRYCKSSNTVLVKDHNSHGYNEWESCVGYEDWEPPVVATKHDFFRRPIQQEVREAMARRLMKIQPGQYTEIETRDEERWPFEAWLLSQGGET